MAGAGEGLPAKDALGNDIKASEWIKTHPPGDRSLAQGLKSDATYLIGAPRPAASHFALSLGAEACAALGLANSNRVKGPTSLRIKYRDMCSSAVKPH